MTDPTANVDAIMDALRHRYRRRLLLDLHYADDPINPFETIAAISDGSAESNEVRISLIHLHLPKLDDMGFIDWDADNDRITPGVRFDDLDPFLESLEADLFGE